MLTVVLYGSEILSLALKEERRLTVFQNKVIEKIFNAELHALYSLPNIIRNLKSRRLRWAERVTHMEQSRNAYRVLVGKPEGKRSIGKLRCKWKDNIKMDLREMGCDPADWIDLTEDRDQ